MTTHPAGALTGLRLRSFRRFVDTEDIGIEPITLLFGKNSSGKTSVLRAPMLIRQLVESPNATDVPLAGAHVDFGSYQELVYEGALRRDVILSVDLDFRRGSRRLPRTLREVGEEYRPLLEQATVDIELHWNVRNSITQIDRISVHSSRTSARLDMNRRGPAEFSIEAPSLSRRIIHHGPLSFATLRFLQLESNSNDPKARVEELQSIDYLIFLLSNQIQEACRGFTHIGPLRQMPDRAYRLDQASPAGTVGSVVETLERQSAAQEVVSSALASMGIARDVSLRRLAPGYVGIVLTDPSTGRQDNLADVGFGVSQVLPILVTLVTARAGSTILIEQPELHLHPDAQGQLADVMFRLGRERRLTLIMETHSEHFLLRLQRRIAERQVDEGDVATYFVDDGTVRRAGIAEDGRIDSRAMPDGFFEEDWEDALELARAAAHTSSGRKS